LNFAWIIFSNRIESIIHETLLHRFLIARTASSLSFNLFQQAFASGVDEHKSVAFPHLAARSPLLGRWSKVATGEPFFGRPEGLLGSGRCWKMRESGSHVPSANPRNLVMINRTSTDGMIVGAASERVPNVAFGFLEFDDALDAPQYLHSILHQQPCLPLFQPDVICVVIVIVD
jgi:hypothetical protein